LKVVRPKGFEPPTYRFEVSKTALFYIQLHFVLFMKALSIQGFFLF
jgi:hypothetical protein